MALYREITWESIEMLVQRFYEKALFDQEIGHFFALELGEDLANEEWRDHIARLVDFWGSVFLDERRYRGDAYGPHFTLVGLKKEHFYQWMKLFNQTADEVYAAAIATKFKDKGLYYSEDFMRRMNQKRDAQDLKKLKSKISWEG